MFKFVFSALMIFSFASTAGAARGKTYNYKANWIESKKVSHKEGDADVEMQMFQRLIRLGDVIVPAATLTVGEIKSTSEDAFPKSLESAVEQITGIKKWRKEVRGSYTAFEAPVPDHASYMKIFISKQKGSYKYSLANIRYAYMMPTYFETELIQREQIGDLKGVASLSEKFGKYASLYRMMIPNAEAGPADLLSRYTGILTTGHDIGAAYNNGLTTINGVRTSVDNLGDVATMNVNNAINALNTNVASVNQTAGTINGTARDFNNTLKGFQNPAKMAKVAAAAGFAGGFAGVAGAALAQAIGTGFYQHGRKIYYAVIGDLPPEIRDQLFEDGKKAWDDLERYSDQMSDMENELSKNLIAITELSGEDAVTTFRDIDKKIAAKNKEFQDIAVALGSDIKSDPDGKICGKLMDRAIELRQQITTLEALKPILAATPKDKLQKDICGKLERLYKSWIGIELGLSNGRQILLNNVDLLFRAAGEKVAAASKNVQSGRETDTSCEKSVEAERKATNNDLSSRGCSSCSDSVIPAKCVPYCGSLHKLDGYVADCLWTKKRNESRDLSAERIRQVDLLAQYGKMMRDNYDSLANAYCEEGQTTEGCNGKAGSYGAIRSNMQKMFEKAAGKCPGANIHMATAAEISRDTKNAQEIAKSDLPIASVKAIDAPTSVGTGLFSKIGNFIGDIGDWFTGLFKKKS